MKMFTRMLIYVTLAVLLTGFRAVAGPGDFLFTIANDAQTSDKTYEFDLYLLDTDPAQTFELSTIQAGIVLNPAIYNGGTLTASILPGTSDLVAAQQPTGIVWSQLQNAIKITPNSPPSVGQGTIISQTGQGSRVCRVRITNSNAFTVNTQPNLAFNFTVSPYPTKIAQIAGGISTQLTCNATNCISNATNALFNPPSCPLTTIGTVTDICPNTSFQVPVTVSNFIQVGAISLTINYDVNVMDFVSGINTSNYPGLTINEPNAGEIKIAGFSSNPAGISLANNATLFTLNFNYLSGTGTISFNHAVATGNEYAGIPPLYEPYNDIPESNYYFDGSVNGDQTDPVITCPANVSIQAPAGTCFALNPALGTPQTSDNCSVNTVSNDFSSLFPNGQVPIGVHNITWTVTDFNNNSATCVQTLTVTQGADPVFDPMGPYCQNSTAPSLPLNSTNGITGSWAPATINTSTAGTFNYVFTPDADECSNAVTVQITIDPLLTPTFNQIGSLCQNTTAPLLPTVSLNSVSGTWSPAAINTTVPGTSTYTFTPSAGECAVQASMDITIDPLVTPTFTQIDPICQYTTAPQLPLTSLNGVTGTWNPATISTAAAGTFTFTFTPAEPYCTTTATMDIVITPSVTPTFSPIEPLCENSSAPLLPTTSNNGITGTWSPAAISTVSAGTFTFTFTPDASFCAVAVTMDIVITAPTTPLFNEIGSLCQNSVPPVLPTLSNNNISGTWNPAAINTSTTGTIVYTFTPDAGFCATTATMSITIDTQVTPIFSQIGPLCQNSVAPQLPLTSNNNVTGTWEPAVISTATPGSFVFNFTPEAGSCAVPSSMTIVVDPLVIPTFDPMGPYCQNSVAAQLPLVSTNGVAGTWSPAIINTATPGTSTYTFTPDSPWCTSTTTLDVTITPLEIPVFTSIDPLCLNSQAPVLPVVSNNGISGTWNPSTINTSVAGTSEYVFTPDLLANPCAGQVSMFITINALPTATISGSTTTCPGVPVDLTVQLTGASPWVYYWSDDNGATTHMVNASASPSTFSVSPSVTTNYIITDVQDGNGCNNTGTGTATVTGDEELPSITCPTPALSYSPDNGCTWTGTGLDAIISDNCGTPVLSYSINGGSYVQGDANGYAFPVGTTNVTYRVIDGSGNVNTCSFQIYVAGTTVTGNISYYNVSATPMNNVQVNLMQNADIIHTATTDNNGNYTFSDVCPGTYDVAFVTAKPAGGINATDAAQLNAWGVGPQYAIEKVRFLAGDVIGPDILNATDASRILTHFVSSANPPFTSEWTFWNTADLVTSNAPQTTQLSLTVPSSATPVTANYYALVTGDFNRSFNPGAAKSTAVVSDLALVHEGVVEVYPDEIFMLPLTAGIDMQISAISLILEFPADRLEILGVYLGNDTNIPLEYAVIGNQLRIGWQSIIHLSALTGDAVVTLKVKNLTKIQENETLTFNLYPDTLNELADQNYEVIYDAVLMIDDIKGNTVGTNDLTLSDAFTFSTWPNPTSGKVNIKYSVPSKGKVAIEIASMMGEKVRKSDELNLSSGEYTSTFDITNLVKGVYAVTINYQPENGTVQTKTIKLIKQ